MAQIWVNSSGSHRRITSSLPAEVSFLKRYSNKKPDHGFSYKEKDQELDGFKISLLENANRGQDLCTRKHRNEIPQYSTTSKDIQGKKNG